MELFHEAWFFFDVTLNAVGYKNTILATEAVNFMHKNGHGFLFQQDHACPHTASMSMAFCKQLAIDVISMDLIEHFWDLTTVSDANNKSYQIWYIPRVIISRISFSKRSSLQYVIKLSMPRVDTLGTELLFTVFPWTLKL
jgi:hypothetical protein